MNLFEGITVDHGNGVICLVVVPYQFGFCCDELNPDLWCCCCEFVHLFLHVLVSAKEQYGITA